MKNRDRYLSGILLILIGVIIGTLISFYQQVTAMDDFAKVEVTDLRKSNKPIFSEDDLAHIDDRFLFKKVAENVTQTVVYIETTVPFSEEDLPDDENHRGEGFWDNFIPRRAKTVGSGVIISSDGYILTNNHVVEGAIDDKIDVTLNDKRSFKGRIVGQDPTTDLAILRISASDLPSIVIGNSDEVNVGEWVLAIGNPFRLRSTVTAGIVSALSRDVQIINDQMRVESFIQTDAAINKGNSGGPLVNTSGELIGVNTAIASQSGSYQGYGFAVPSNLAFKVAKDIIEYGEVHRALLGVTIVSVDADLARQLGMDQIRGVEVTMISPDGGAEKAGIMPEDVILSVDGVEVNESNQLQQKIAVRNPGDTVTLNIWRSGKEITKKVELGMLNENSGQLASNESSRSVYDGNSDDKGEKSIAFESFSFGIRVMALYHADGSTGYNIIVTDVIAGSEADKQGFKEGYRIKEIADRKVEDLESLKDLIGQFSESGKPLSFTVENREGEKMSLQIQP